MSDVQLNKLLACYGNKYHALYEGTLHLPANLYDLLVRRFDNHDYDRAVLLQFNKLRGDVIVSDREAVAFMLAYDQTRV